MTYPWGIGVATGIGSLPHVDPDEAAHVVTGELPDFPHLPELPLRGAGAGMIGRTASLLVDLHVDLQPAGWRLTDRPGADERGHVLCCEPTSTPWRSRHSGTPAR